MEKEVAVLTNDTTLLALAPWDICSCAMLIVSPFTSTKGLTLFVEASKTAISPLPGTAPSPVPPVVVLQLVA